MSTWGNRGLERQRSYDFNRFPDRERSQCLKDFYIISRQALGDLERQKSHDFNKFTDTKGGNHLFHHAGVTRWVSKEDWWENTVGVQLKREPIAQKGELRLKVRLFITHVQNT